MKILINAFLFLFFLCLNVISIDAKSRNFVAKKQCAPRCADYIVIGVGTAGAVVAKQLSDDMKSSVIALHNGENLTEDPFFKYSQFAPLLLYLHYSMPLITKQEKRYHNQMRTIESYYGYFLCQKVAHQKLMLVHTAEAPIPSMRNGKLLQVKIGQSTASWRYTKDLKPILA